ncbi:Ribose-5-phosphate isomerase A,ribose-5-phosphate isomerase A,Ribose 5-phosphate isomerase,ribose 5-phosphate isomerase A,Ribose 5-phosphate isomerase A (phosphoriboisomerase A) [Chlamydia poikilotherma]|uniref:Ribose-5-phosphate isomerase A n=1 Tax=Chlamydia poikilotherma TaxID=1967783 RepID=A0A3B0PPW2_9CHLA|nr:ribose 5-phosphate isomerase A [Chlamydia poikilotherma]SYX09100.1 Ribose-5-phosphate isomerase A,ribose-5-phosphate isomerase A,Ribose 5-phosphate isomerase,ribose 5-phosphate isomerase A,Ribose 5-phosphate isomerase A (phosphoriboisomerase A) [Chlamydia poikilotherma]
MKEDPYLEIKRHLAREAADLVTSGMLLGLGSGSTSREFIKAVSAKQKQENLDIRAIASSKESYSLASSLGIPLIDDEEFTETDLAVDGADEIDPQLRMIKGGGGAIFREKILLQSSQRCLILADESKSVEVLGKFGVPVEISPFGKSSILAVLENLGYQGNLRKNPRGGLFITNNGNYIYDIHTPNVYPHPEEDLLKLLQIHGIIEVGFVIANVEVWFGYTNGQIGKKNTGKV